MLLFEKDKIMEDKINQGQLDFYVTFGNDCNGDEGWLIAYKGEESYLTFTEGYKELVFDTESDAMSALLKFIDAGYFTVESTQTLTDAKIRQILNFPEDEDDNEYCFEYLKVLARYINGASLTDLEEEILEWYEKDVYFVHEHRVHIMARIGANTISGINK